MRAQFIDNWMDTFQDKLSLSNDNTLSDLSTFVLGAIAFAMAVIVIFSLKLLGSRYHKITPIAEKIRSKLLFNSIARLLIQQYFKICLFSFKNLKSLTSNENN